jgi:hypothetical protein
MRPYTIPAESYQLLVPQVGLEPTRLSTLASKTSVATITPPGQNTALNFNEQPHCLYQQHLHIIRSTSLSVNTF